MLASAPSSPLRGKYLVRNRLANWCLAMIDGVTSRLTRARAVPGAIDPPQRILLANGAHLGDVVLATSVLPVLKQAFPRVRIGFLVGSWAQCVLRNHPLVDWIHVVDHWKLNRSSATPGQKLEQYLRTRRRALPVIRRRRYDVAIDLYYFFPNFIPLLWQAAIPLRIGYRSGGFGPLLTHALDWTDRDCHVTDYQIDLLRLLPISQGCCNEIRLSLPPLDLTSIRSFEQMLPRSFFDRSGFLILHLGAGAAWKAWPHDCWRQLVERLHQAGWRLVFTGNSPAEHRTIESVMHGLVGCINLCGLLSWPAFVAAIRQARLVVGVDSVAGHVAAAIDTPSVIVGSGITRPSRWRPLHAHSQVVSQTVHCAPCHRSRGCDTMECVRAVTVDRVYQAVETIASRHSIETLAS